MTCRFVLNDVGRGSWEQVRIPVAGFFRLSDRSRPAPDELVDDVEFVEILR